MSTSAHIRDELLILEALFDNEIEKNIQIISYFNLMYFLSQKHDFDEIILNILQYGAGLFAQDIKIGIRKKYQRHFRMFYVKEGKLQTIPLTSNVSSCNKNKYLNWFITPDIKENQYFDFFNKIVSSTLSNKVKEELLIKQKHRIEDLYYQLKKQKLILDNAIKNINIAVFIIDKRDKLIFCNEMGHSFLDGNKNINSFIEEHRTKSFQLNNKMWMIKVKKRYYSVSSEKIMQNGNGLRIIKLEDITDFKKIDDIKNIFVSGISHEIKTPLTSLISGIKLFAMGKLGNINKEQADFLKVVIKDSNYLMELLDNLIYIGNEKISNNDLPIHENIDISDLIENILGVYSNDITLKNIKITKILDRKCFSSDYLMLKQILSNLISNAIKFNKINGRIDITLRHFKGLISIKITDTGCGIPKEKIPVIYNKYRRINENCMRIDGIGLGLFVVKRNVEKLGGNISVKCKIDCGSEFEVTLPPNSKC